MINYGLLAEALEYYQDQGYELIDVPWTVSKQSMNITAGESIDLEKSKYIDDYLVGSAEQSFLHMIRGGEISEGRFCAVTPCFRSNDPEDELHQKYFMKVELISITKEWWKWVPEMEMMLTSAKDFFSQFVDVEVVKTQDDRSDESYDIECHGIELGSYGIRHFENINWIYGTGLAEPRLSTVMNREFYGNN